MYSLSAYKYIKSGAQDLTNLNRPTKYPNYKSDFDYTGLQMPLSISNIAKFEKMNQISINVYSLDTTKKNSKVKPLCISQEQTKETVNLLLLLSKNKAHYCFIRNFNKLIGKSGVGKVYCHYCLQGFRTERKGKLRVKEHENHCRQNNAARVCFPKNDTIKFCSTRKQLKLPFTIYADFECLICSSDINNSGQKTETLCNHIDCGYSFVTISDFFPPNFQVFRGQNAGEQFLDEILKERDRILKLFETEGQKKMLKLTHSERKRFKNAKNCHICNKPFNDVNDKVRDHCHFTGKFRDAAHNQVNRVNKSLQTKLIFFV